MKPILILLTVCFAENNQLSIPSINSLSFASHRNATSWTPCGTTHTSTRRTARRAASSRSKRTSSRQRARKIGVIWWRSWKVRDVCLVVWFCVMWRWNDFCFVWCTSLLHIARPCWIKLVQFGTILILLGARPCVNIITYSFRLAFLQAYLWTRAMKRPLQIPPTRSCSDWVRDCACYFYYVLVVRFGFESLIANVDLFCVLSHLMHGLLALLF